MTTLKIKFDSKSRRGNTKRKAIVIIHSNMGRDQIGEMNKGLNGFKDSDRSIAIMNIPTNAIVSVIYL